MGSSVHPQKELGVSQSKPRDQSSANIRHGSGILVRVILSLASIWAFALTTGACSSSKPPNIRDIYNRSAKGFDQNRNPVIVIPGVLGSRLEDAASQKTVWGAFGGRGVNVKQAADQRLFALPMDPKLSFDQLTDDVEPAGVLDRIRMRIVGLPLQLKAYHQILMTLGVGGYRDDTISDIDYGENHFTCFQFDYDWRRDNVENAHRLADFIEEKQAYVQAEMERLYPEREEPIKFDIIAHSMGGLLTRYFLRYGTADLPADGTLPEVTWAGAEHVEKVVVIGTPNAGAVDALMQLVEGRKFGPMTPRYEASLLATFPSAYQLLPRVRHKPLVDDRGQALDFMDPELWRQHGWGIFNSNQEGVLAALLPDVATPEDRLNIAEDHLRKGLARAQHLHAALDQPAQPPPDIDLYLIAGDSEATPKTVVAGTAGLKIKETAHGDGTVLRSSALMDERIGQVWTPVLQSPISWSHVTFLFDDHLGLTQNPVFTDNLLYLLLEEPR